MDFNSLIFPVPKPSYTKKTFIGQLIWIPKKTFTYKDKLKYSIHNKKEYPKKSTITKKIVAGKVIYHNKSSSMAQAIPSISFQIDNKFTEFEKINETTTYIPCLFLKSKIPSEKILIYFHSNYEDLGNTFPLCSSICKNLNINVLSVEYPGYGIYKSSSPATEDEITNDAELIFKFINEIESVKESNIILMGRCIGSGPATYLAMKHNILSLVLLSAFKSIKEAVKTMFPKLNFGNFLQTFVKERFNNFDNISRVESPVLLIHGKNDTTIPPIHSSEMINQIKSPAKLVMPCNMTHTSFDFYRDVVSHIRDFIKVFTNNSVESSSDSTDEGVDDGEDIIEFPSWMYQCPV